MRKIITALLGFYSGGDGIFPLKADYDGRTAGRAMVLTPGDIPTTEIYLKDRLARRFHQKVAYIDTFRTNPGNLQLKAGTFVVIVRYAPWRWLRKLECQSDCLTGVALLLDDDIPAAASSSELPLHYAIKTGWRYARIRRLLSKLCSEVWFSTSELLHRYPTAAASLLEPGFLEPCRKKDGVTYFYHGTWAHRDEIRWLVPVVRRIQEAVPRAWFEIMGTDRVWKLFCNIPRVRVVHPLPWKDYRDYGAVCRYQVGLAPMFDTPFNRARSHNKIFDITRLGAVGIYSDVTPYKEKIEHGKTGLLCHNNPDKWASATIALLVNPQLTSYLHVNALNWCRNSENVRAVDGSRPVGEEILD